tara:strand:- start:111 stop:470 length:360 start_codon:yes stop_codon:yes gene_type:complete
MEKIVTNKSALFAGQAREHYIRVAPDSDEYLKVWVKEPTWLQVEQAMNSVMKLDAKTGEMNLDLNAMYKFMVENFIEKTEPELSKIDYIRLSPYIGNQLKEILPNPMQDMIQGDDQKNE